jgi:hypothetical protein
MFFGTAIIQMLEIKGAEEHRETWEESYGDAFCLIYVINVSDPDRMQENYIQLGLHSRHLLYSAELTVLFDSEMLELEAAHSDTRRCTAEQARGRYGTDRPRNQATAQYHFPAETARLRREQHRRNFCQDWVRSFALSLTVRRETYSRRSDREGIYPALAWAFGKAQVSKKNLQNVASNYIVPLIPVDISVADYVTSHVSDQLSNFTSAHQDAATSAIGNAYQHINTAYQAFQNTNASEYVQTGVKVVKNYV